MSLRKLVISAREGDDASLLSDLLIELGALSVSVSDQHEGTLDAQSIFADVNNESVIQPHPQDELWTDSKIQAWFPLETDAENMVMNLAANFGLPRTPSFSIESWDGSDNWVDEMKKFLRYIDIGDTRIDFPGCESEAADAGVRPKFRLLLEPGSAFGTGQHATTQLCVRWLARELPTVQPISLLDYGCGNGVLAIRAALHQGHVRVVGVDVDPDAVAEANLNAVRNGVHAKARFYSCEDEPSGETYDIVVANILAPVLLSLAPMLVNRMKNGGRIVISGFLCCQALEVRTMYKSLGLDMAEGEIQSEWTILSGVKKSS